MVTLLQDDSLRRGQRPVSVTRGLRNISAQYHNFPLLLKTFYSRSVEVRICADESPRRCTMADMMFWKVIAWIISEGFLVIWESRVKFHRVPECLLFLCGLEKQKCPMDGVFKGLEVYSIYLGVKQLIHIL